MGVLSPDRVELGVVCTFSNQFGKAEGGNEKI